MDKQREKLIEAESPKHSQKGDERIAEILCEEYGIKDLTPYEEIDYEIENFSEELSRVKIRSKTNRCFCCPVYALFDGYHMSWYGDYGFWGFCCTWKTNVMNLAYKSPYYQLEKLESRDREEFDEKTCAEKFLKLIKEGDWYNFDLDEEQQKRFGEFMSEPHDYISYYDDVLSEHKDLCEKLKDLYDATEDEYSWVAELRKTNFEEDLSNVFECEEYDLYRIGKKSTGQIFHNPVYAQRGCQHREGFEGGGVMKRKLRIWLINTLKWWIQKLGGNYELLDKKSLIVSRQMNVERVTVMVESPGSIDVTEELAMKLGRSVLPCARILKTDSLGGPLDPPLVAYLADLRVIPFNDEV